MQKIGFLIYPSFQSIGVAAASVFEVANYVSEQPIYDIRMISECGGMVEASAALEVRSAPFSNESFDTLIICGGIEPPVASEETLAFLRRSAASTRRLASTCTGTFLLAQAGLLNGRRATTHWALAQNLKSQFPAAQVEEDRIYIVDGNIWTSAGMTAGIDMALAMVEKDLGAEAARSIAQKMVLYHRRAGGQSQHSALLDILPRSNKVQSALDYAKRNLHTSLTVEQLAEAAHLSLRQFNRSFSEETGMTPAKAIEKLRVEAAQLMLEQARHPMEVIARETGFKSRERMRRAFVRVLGFSPMDIRRDQNRLNAFNI